jgi:hypothetical protein
MIPVDLLFKLCKVGMMIGSLIFNIFDKPTVKKTKVVYKKYNGKSILVTGRPTTGKTTLTSFIKLGYNTIVQRRQTTKEQTYEIQWEELVSEDFKKITDCRAHVANEIEQAEINEVNKADVILYLFNAKTILNNKEEKEINRIKSELKTLNDYVENKKFIAIGTHMDYITGFEKNEDKIINKLKNNINIKNIQCDCSNLFEIVYVSLNEKYIGKHIKRVLQVLIDINSKGENL